jgi:MYXO-CTERM domain-containing protein
MGDAALAASPTAPPPPLLSAPAAGKLTGAGGEDSDPWSTITLYGAIGLALAGAALWISRRRRGLSPASSIDVIAQRALGARAKVVWLAAGDREMIVAITPQQVRVLDSWRKSDRPSTAGASGLGDAAFEHPGGSFERPSFERPGSSFERPASSSERPGSSFERPGTSSERPGSSFERPGTQEPVDPSAERRPRAGTSPAVAGIMRLRAKTAPPAPAMRDDDDPEDIAWAQELLAATGRRSPRREDDRR